jgi:hypothetical protein
VYPIFAFSDGQLVPALNFRIPASVMAHDVYMEVSPLLLDLRCYAIDTTLASFCIEKQELS